MGKTTRETVNALLEAEGGEADVIAIGPAGERRVRFACLTHYWKNREAVAGRGGIAAVLGAKNVKAVVVKGGRKTEIAEPARLKALLEATREPLKTGTKALSVFGTPFLVGPINALGALGAYNLRQETFAEARAVSGEDMKDHFHDRDTTCLKCPVACGKQYAIRDGEFAGTRAKMPEYESIFALGPMLGNAHPESLILANDLCDTLGLDTITMGVTLAFVAEAIERGWLTAADLGVPFGWGDWRGMLKLVEMTARREGFGDRLAEGAWRLAESVHPEATKLVYAVKRLELPAHSARALKGMSIGYATATRGGSHHDTRPTPQYAPTFDRRTTKDKPAFAMRSQHFTAVGDSLVLCRFTSERGFGLFVGEPYAAMVGAVTGWDVTADELERVGERIINLERLFNVREGVRRRDDVLPWRVMHEPIPDGPSAGMYCPPEELECHAGRVLWPARLGRRRRAHRRAPGHPRPARIGSLRVGPEPMSAAAGTRRGAAGSPRSRRRDRHRLAPVPTPKRRTPGSMAFQGFIAYSHAQWLRRTLTAARNSARIQARADSSAGRAQPLQG